MLFNLPNFLTLSRIFVIPIIVGLFYLRGDEARWLALTLFILAGITDYFDGYFARRWAQISPLGRFLDPIADKLLVAAVILILVAKDQITGWVVLPALIILCREVLVSGLREFLAQANVGIAVGSGTDVAAETADIVLVESNPRDIAKLILFGKATYRKMIQNLVWATAYNAVAIPLAAGVLAGIGFDWLLTQIAARGRAWATAALVAIGVVLLWNAAILIELHPYQYLYYNPLVGGIEGASRRYVMDYWVNIMTEAVDDLEAYVATLDKSGGAGHRYTVAVCGERLPFEQEAGPGLQWVEDWNKADFFIAPTHMNCDRALDGKVIATISRLGAPIGVVKDRRALVHPAIANHR